MRSLPIFSVLTLASVLVASCVQESEDDQDGSRDALFDVDSADDSSADASLAPDSPQCPWVGNIDLDDEAAVQAFIDSGCDTIVGDLTLVNSERERLPVVPVRFLEGTLNIIGCPRLVSLDGLESLVAATSIILTRSETRNDAGESTFVGLDSLTDLSALSNVVRVEQRPEDFRELPGILAIGYAPQLRSLTGLERAAIIGSFTLIELPVLQDLEGLGAVQRLFQSNVRDCPCVEWAEYQSFIERVTLLTNPYDSAFVPSNAECLERDAAEGSSTEP